MTSAIDPSDIDSTFPIAGVDNNSQGFRDNFAAIKTNFTSAEAEITALQANTAKTNADNNFAGNQLYNAKFKYNSNVIMNHGTSSGSVTLNFQDGQYHVLTTSGNITLAFSNWPTTGSMGFVTLELTLSSGSHEINFPAAVTLPFGYTNPTSAGTYIFTFFTHDAGATVYAVNLSDDNNFGHLGINGNTISSLNTNGNISLDPNGTGFVSLEGPAKFGQAAQELSGAGAVDATSAITHLSNTGANALTLADGTAGQVKVITMTSYTSGDSTLTPTNAVGFTTIVFNAVGETATLMFTNSKWIVIGSQGATIS